MSNVIDINNGLVFREDFKDEFSVRKNGGTPTNVVFEDNKAVFNSDGYIITSIYPDIEGSIRAKFTLNRNDGDAQILVGSQSSYRCYLSIRDGYISGGIGTQTSSAIKGNTLLNINEEYEAVITWDSNNVIVYLNSDIEYSNTQYGTTVTGVNYYIGSHNTNDTPSLFTEGKIYLVEIYNRALSAEEVYNLYNNTQVPKDNILFDLTSQNGYIEDRTGNQTLSPSNVELKKLGHIYNMQYSGNSQIDTGSNFIGIKSITSLIWFKPDYIDTGSSAQRIISNAGYDVWINIDDDTVRFSTNAGSNSINSTSIIKKDRWNFVAIIVKSSTVQKTIYYGDLTNPPIQNAQFTVGTITAGITNVFIGNRNDIGRWYSGFIGPLTVFEGILTLNEITKYWSDTKKLLR